MEKKPLVVLDTNVTNVFVSALLSPNGVPGIILKRFRDDAFEIVTSQAQLKEIKAVLGRPSLKRALPTGSLKDVMHFFRGLKKLVAVARPKSHPWEFKDKGDHFLLDLVIHAKADFLVTGDRALQSLGILRECSIVSPSEFMARL